MTIYVLSSLISLVILQILVFSSCLPIVVEPLRRLKC